MWSLAPRTKKPSLVSFAEKMDGDKIIWIVQNTTDLEVSKVVTHFSHLNEAKMVQLSNIYGRLFDETIILAKDREIFLMKIKVMKEEIEDLKVKLEEASKVASPPVLEIEALAPPVIKEPDVSTKRPDKEKNEVALGALANILQHRCEIIKGKMDSIHDSFNMLHKINGYVKAAMAILEPLFNIQSCKGPLFEKLEVLRPHRPNILETFSQVGEMIELIGATLSFFKGKSNQIR